MNFFSFCDAEYVPFVVAYFLGPIGLIRPTARASVQLDITSKKRESITLKSEQLGKIYNNIKMMNIY